MIDGTGISGYAALPLRSSIDRHVRNRNKSRGTIDGHSKLTVQICMQSRH